jgi:hypothetical protein
LGLILNWCFLGGAASASASTFCVAGTGCVAAGGTARSTVQNALDGILRDSTAAVPMTVGGAAAARVDDGKTGTIEDAPLSGHYATYAASQHATPDGRHRPAVQALRWCLHDLPT